jgi:hypothetical protein
MQHSLAREANIHSDCEETPPPPNGTRRFIAVFTRARCWSLSWARCIQSTLFHPVSLRSFIILPSTPRSTEWSLAFWFCNQKFCSDLTSIFCCRVRSKESVIPRPFVTFRNKLVFCGRPLANHLLLAVHDYLFNIFAFTFYIRRLSPPSTTRGHAVPWW